MGCNDYPEPLTPEQAREVRGRVERAEQQRDERADAYRASARKVLDQGARMSVTELVSVVLAAHAPSEFEVHQAILDMLLGGEYGSPDLHWRWGCA
jgi:hypothetical protein